MEEVLTEQSLDEHIWSILACSENAHDLLHYVHHTENRDGRHELALDAAQYYWGNNCQASLMIGITHCQLNALGLEDRTAKVKTLRGQGCKTDPFVWRQ